MHLEVVITEGRQAGQRLPPGQPPVNFGRSVGAAESFPEDSFVSEPWASGGEETMPPGTFPDRNSILRAIDLVLNECIKSQLAFPDVVVGQEIIGLQNVRIIVEQQWPLSEAMKAQFNIGPVAAKNIADWNDSLATALMVLHHVLKHDGDSLYKLLGAPPA
jgi:hypothetical protein